MNVLPRSLSLFLLLLPLMSPLAVAQTGPVITHIVAANFGSACSPGQTMFVPVARLGTSASAFLGSTQIRVLETFPIPDGFTIHGLRFQPQTTVLVVQIPTTFAVGPATLTVRSSTGVTPGFPIQIDATAPAIVDDGDGA